MNKAELSKNVIKAIHYIRYAQKVGQLPTPPRHWSMKDQREKNTTFHCRRNSLGIETKWMPF